MVHNEKERVWDVIIIGAGIAGLTASIHLARAGLSVMVIEKAPSPGGRGMSQEFDGARLNLGAHAVYMEALDLLNEVGVEPKGASPKLGGPFIFQQNKSGGGEIAVPFHKLLLGSHLTWREKSELISFYIRLRKMDPATLQNITIQQLLERELQHPRVRNIVLGLIRLSTYCHAPEVASAGPAIEQLQHGKVIYVDGGWQSIADQLKNTALSAGVQFKFNSPVRQISGYYPDMSVLTAAAQGDAQELRTRCALSSAGPKEMLRSLSPSLPPAEADQYTRLLPVQAACLDLLIEDNPRSSVTFALGADLPWYFSNHSAAAKLTQHPDHAVWHVMKYLHPEAVNDPGEVQLELERFLDLIQPGWKSRVLKRRYLPRMTVSHAMVTAGMGGVDGRPKPSVQGHPGLYIAGDWVGSQGLLLNASLASAKEAALSIINKMGRQTTHL